VTTLTVTSEPSVAPAGDAPGQARIALGETFGFLGTWLRLVWRHWPVLLSLALAGSIARSVLIDVAVWASHWRDGLGGLLVFPLIPSAMLIAMVLMLRVVRGSLPYLGQRSRPESMMAYLGAVLIPFLLYYAFAGYTDEDLSHFTHAVQVDIYLNTFTGDFVKVLTRGWIVVAIAAGAFMLRLALTRTGLVRKVPGLVLLALYLEVLWIYTTYRLSSEYRPDGENWIANSKAWQGMVTWWHTQYDPSSPVGAAANAAKSVVDTFLAQADVVILAPVTGLIAGSVVLAARTRRARVEPERDGTGSRRAFRIGAEVGRPVSGRLALMSDGTKRTFQAGVLPTMVFCLVYVALGIIPSLLGEPERALIGPRDFDRVWALVSLPLTGFNDAVQLMLVIALVAAFVDRTAARIARRAGVSTVDKDGPAPQSPAFAAVPLPTRGASPAGTALVPATVSYAPAGTGLPSTGTGLPVAGTPSFGGISPVTPTYTTSVQAPSFGSGFGPPLGVTPPPSGPATTPPSGLTSGLWDDGKPDVAGKSVDPGEDDRGWSGFGR
jgi:hypothetical protein